MDKRGHVLNAILLAIGIGYVLEPGAGVETARKIAQISVPVILGALIPDVDTAFGKHRKTAHNLPVLGVFVAYPILFDNLHFVWVGVVTHYLLDLLGSKRGLAFFYPYSKEYSLPVGVSTSSSYSDLVTVLVTAFELVLFAAVHYYVVSLDSGLAETAHVIGL